LVPWLHAVQLENVSKHQLANDKSIMSCSVYRFLAQPQLLYIFAEQRVVGILERSRRSGLISKSDAIMSQSSMNLSQVICIKAQTSELLGKLDMH
jgi:hypothetical protein